MAPPPVLLRSPAADDACIDVATRFYPGLVVHPAAILHRIPAGDANSLAIVGRNFLSRFDAVQGVAIGSLNDWRRNQGFAS